SPERSKSRSRRRHGPPRPGGARPDHPDGTLTPGRTRRRLRSRGQPPGRPPEQPRRRPLEPRHNGGRTGYRVHMVDQPRLGDAFGQLMVAAFAELTGARRRASVGAAAARPTIEIVERDDGLIDGSLAARYFSGPDRWQPFDLRALDQMR